MPDWQQKVTRGSRVQRPNADMINGAIDAARKERRERFQSPAAVPEPDLYSSQDVIRVASTSTNVLDRFAVLQLGGPLINPDDNLTQWQNFPNLAAATVTNTAAPFCITLDPLTGNGVGRGVVSGAVPCQVDVTNASHGYAGPVADVTAYLASAVDGPCRIIWKPSDTGVVWCLVLIMPAAGSSAATAYPDCIWLTNTSTSMTVDVSLPWTLDYLDTPNGGVTSDGAFRGLTSGTMAAGIADGIRGVRHVSVDNTSTTTQTVTIALDVDSVLNNLVTVALEPSCSLHFDAVTAEWYTLCTGCGKLEPSAAVIYGSAVTYNGPTTFNGPTVYNSSVSFSFPISFRETVNYYENVTLEPNVQLIFAGTGTSTAYLQYTPSTGTGTGTTTDSITHYGRVNHQGTTVHKGNTTHAGNTTHKGTTTLKGPATFQKQLQIAQITRPGSPLPGWFYFDLDCYLYFYTCLTSSWISLILKLDYTDGSLPKQPTDTLRFPPTLFNITRSGTTTSTSFDISLKGSGITNAYLGQMPNLTIKGNNTGTTNNPVDLTAAQTTAMLNIAIGAGTGHLKGLVPDPGATAHTPPYYLGDDMAYHNVYPLTTAGDIVYASETGSPAPPARLAIGSEGDILTVAGDGLPEWISPEGAGLFTNPMTKAGDLVYGSNTATPSTPLALHAGANGDVLTVNAGLPEWQAPSALGIPTAGTIGPSLQWMWFNVTFAELAAGGAVNTYAYVIESFPNQCYCAAIAYEVTVPFGTSAGTIGFISIYFGGPANAGEVVGVGSPTGAAPGYVQGAALTAGQIQQPAATACDLVLYASMNAGDVSGINAGSIEVGFLISSLAP